MANPSNEKWSPEVGGTLCDRLTVNSSIPQAAKFVSVTGKCALLWMRASARDQANDVPLEKSKFAIRWPRQQEGDAEPPLIWFHEAVVLSQKLYRAMAESNLRALLADTEEGGGIIREVLDGTGRPVWEVDTLRAAHALEMNDDMWSLTYGDDARRDDIYKRDAEGRLIPKKVRDPLPSQTLIHLARSLFGSTFNPSERRESDVNVKVETLVIDGALRKKIDSPMRAELEARLREIRADPNRASAKPTGPVAMIGRGNPNDPPERITGLADDAAPRLADHPRAYVVPTPSAPKPASYARPNTRLDAQDRRGPMPSGGVRVS